MQFSHKITKIKPSPTLAITALAKSMKAEGIDVVSFGAGEPDFDTPENIKEAAIKAINEGKTKYTPAGGMIELKKAITEKFKRDNNLEYQTSEITVNCGGKHSFFNLMQVLLNEGDEVIVPTPYWVSYPPMVSLAGGTPVIVETDDTSGFKMTPAQLEAAITPKTRAVVITSPSNPTGAYYAKYELQALLKVVEGKEILIISDDIYESILYDGVEFCNAAMLSELLKKQTVILNGVSKTYSMTGWRIGYVAADSEIIRKMEVLQSQQTSNPCSIAQWATVEALIGDQSSVATMKEAFLRRRDLTTDGLNNIDGITCLKPAGAFYVFPNISALTKLPGWSKIAAPEDPSAISTPFTQYLLKEFKVAAVPGIGFGADNYMRMSFATSDEIITEGLERIKKCVDSLR